MAETQIKRMSKSIPELPAVIISDILLRLERKDIARYRCVSKDWNSITMDPHFVYTTQFRTPHLILQSKDACRYVMVQDMDLINIGKSPLIVNEVSIDRHKPSSLKILCSCNGLLCIIHRNDINPIFIYNPIKGEALKLPNLPITNVTAFGFGFDQLHNKYKVIFEVATPEVIKINIITLGESSWRTLDCPPELKDHWLFAPFQNAVFFNNSLRWVVFNNKFILSLDICNEKFKTLEIPNYIGPSTTLMNSGESLALVPNNYYHTEFTIWHLHGSNFNEQHFNELFANNRRQYIQLLGKLSDGSYVIQGHDYKTLLYVPMQEKVQEKVRIERIYGIPFHNYEAISFTPSLVFP